MEIKVPPDDLAAASRVAANVSLLGIHLLKAHAQNDLLMATIGREDSLNLDVRFTHEPLGYELPQAGLLLTKVAIRVEYRAAATPKGEPTNGDAETQADRPLAAIEVVYGALYRLPSAEMPDEIEKALPAFAKFNAVFNCWPYLRTEVHRLSMSFNVPYVLPLLRIIPEAKKTEESVVESAPEEQHTQPSNKKSNRKEVNPMAEKYRKRRGKDTWHFCTNCSNWPTYDYDEQPSKPTSGELCNECQAKKREGTCR